MPTINLHEIAFVPLPIKDLWVGFIRVGSAIEKIMGNSETDVLEIARKEFSNLVVVA